MKPLNDIKAMPLSKMTAPEHFALELSYLMREVRQMANRVRDFELQPYYGPALHRSVGRIHGLWFGMHSLLLFTCGATVAEECGELAQAAINEAEFLTGPYLQTGSAA